MADNWSAEELEASVVAYFDMRQNDFQKEPYSKKAYYRELSRRFGRTEKAFEYRLQNISFVLSVMGRDWVKGLKPAKNVGLNVAGEIEKIINRLENRSSALIVPFQTDVSNIRKKKTRSPPIGSEKPRTTEIITSQYVRNAEVVAWVLDLANGVCECCGKASPFLKEGGTPYLEVHHLKRLADSGSDTISNAIAACPNCHRELRYGVDKEAVRGKMYRLLERLIDE
jgi:5-methylcytosine-specific restriction protein A